MKQRQIDVYYVVFPKKPVRKLLPVFDLADSLKTMMTNAVENHYGGEYNFPGLALCAKSGTAEVEGQTAPNSWFVGFLADDDHPYAFVVLIEEGGYGAEVAGSVANTVLQDAVGGHADDGI